MKPDLVFIHGSPSTVFGSSPGLNPRKDIRNGVCCGGLLDEEELLDEDELLGEEELLDELDIPPK